MAAHLAFTFYPPRPSREVYIYGSWDGYRTGLPLSKDRSTHGGWKGRIRLQGKTLQQGSYYYFYYATDSMPFLHDPQEASIADRTTGKRFNVAYIKPIVRQGKPLPASQIQCPRPRRGDAETKKVRSTRFNYDYADSFTARADDYSDSGSDSDFAVPSLCSDGSGSSSRSSSRSSTSSTSSERYDMTRKDQALKLDCKDQTLKLDCKRQALKLDCKGHGSACPGSECSSASASPPPSYSPTCPPAYSLYDDYNRKMEPRHRTIYCR